MARGGGRGRRRAAAVAQDGAVAEEGTVVEAEAKDGAVLAEAIEWPEEDAVAERGARAAAVAVGRAAGKRRSASPERRSASSEEQWSRGGAAASSPERAAQWSPAGEIEESVAQVTRG